MGFWKNFWSLNFFQLTLDYLGEGFVEGFIFIFLNFLWWPLPDWLDVIHKFPVPNGLLNLRNGKLDFCISGKNTSLYPRLTGWLTDSIYHYSPQSEGLRVQNYTDCFLFFASWWTLVPLTIRGKRVDAVSIISHWLYPCYIALNPFSLCYFASLSLAYWYTLYIFDIHLDLLYTISLNLYM